MKSNRKLLRVIIMIYAIMIINNLAVGLARFHDYLSYKYEKVLDIGQLHDISLKIKIVSRYIDLLGFVGIILSLIWLNRTNTGLAKVASMKKMNPWLVNLVWLVPIAGTIVHFILFLRFYKTYRYSLPRNLNKYKSVFILNFSAAILQSVITIVLPLSVYLSIIDGDIFIWMIVAQGFALIHGVACIILFKFFLACEEELILLQSGTIMPAESKLIDD